MTKVCYGDIWLVDFDPTRGSEQAGTRPAVVIQNNTGNRVLPTTVVAAVTGKKLDYPQYTVLEPSHKNGLSRVSTVKTSQLLTISRQRLVKKLGELSGVEIEQLQASLKLSLNLN